MRAILRHRTAAAATTSAAAAASSFVVATPPKATPSRTAAAVAAVAVTAMRPAVTPPARGGGGGKTPPTPPPLRKLPPAPPLPGKSATDSGMFSSAYAFKSPHEVLNMMVEFVPTFYVPLNSVASIMSDDAREFIKTRGKASNFFRRYRFFFDLQLMDGMRYEVRLREDVQHPRRGVADAKFSLADIGENATYAVVPEFVQTLESIDSRADVNVNVAPVLPPPSLHVRLQERVPVLERLKAMIPEDTFVPLDDMAERIPEDIIAHPFFDVQGGLGAIANKFPDTFQVVEGNVRLRPPELAPLALDDFSFDTSPEPEVVAIVRRAVCATDIPTWVSVTGLYEQLSVAQRRSIKRGYKSFASFLRAHGASLALSNDLLKVSHWVPPKKATADAKAKKKKEKQEEEAAAAAATTSASADAGGESSSGGGGGGDAREVVQYTQLHVLNELYDRFPRGREMTLHAFHTQFVPEHLRPSLPKNLAAWLSGFPQYFVVEGAHTTRDPTDVRVRRARDHAPIDIALQLYPHIPEEGIAAVALSAQLPPSLRAHVEQFGIHNIVENLSEWLELLDGDLFRLKSMDELEAAIQGKKSNPAAATAPSGGGGGEDDGTIISAERNVAPVGDKSEQW